MYISDLDLSTKVINTLLRAGINTLEKLFSVIEEGGLSRIKSLGADGYAEVIRETYCRNCKRSIYGDYKDCDINIENDGKYVGGTYKCGCKIRTN